MNIGLSKRSLPVNRNETVESLHGNGEFTKHKSIQSNDSANYKRPNSYVPNLKLETTPKSHKTKKSIRLSDLMAAMYPGVKIGHQYCIQRAMLVPKTMGWLWNTEDTATGTPFPRGWRPGAIALGVKKRFFRQRSTTETLTTKGTIIGSKGKKYKKKAKTTSSTILKSSTTSSVSYTEQRLPPPTLCIQKEGGIYCVKMQPIKNYADKDNINEQPVQFKIAENSNSSYSNNSLSSSSSLKIEYMCTGALRKPEAKPELSEIATQWAISDFEKEHKKEEVKEEESKKSKKKVKKGKSRSKDETNNESMVENIKVDNNEKIPQEKKKR